MTEHSIENLIENIYNSKTRDYFQEVIQTYYTNCFRSSVVMLYSVVISDLIFKLEDLRDIYNDNTAKKILAEIEALQKSNPRSAEWENKLIDMVYERTQLLEISDLENINQLQKHRHLSAHPVLNQTSILYQPNKETVKAHIKNILEGVLTKPPILSARIFTDLILDISNNRDRFSNDEELKRFLNAKYFKGLRQETIDEIFKKLWKLVFKLENEECNLNRDINFRTLEIIYNLNSPEILKLLKNKEIYFNDVLNGTCTNYLFKLLFKYPKIYIALSDLNKATIQYEISQSLVFKLLSWFTYDSFDEYSTKIINILSVENPFEIDKETYLIINNLYKEFDKKKEFIDFLNVMYLKSNLFDTADSNFYRLENFLEDFTPEQLINLLEAVNSNSQIFSRGQAIYSNRIIKNECDKKLPKDFDYKKYRQFRI